MFEGCGASIDFLQLSEHVISLSSCAGSRERDPAPLMTFSSGKKVYSRAIRPFPEPAS